MTAITTILERERPQREPGPRRKIVCMHTIRDSARARNNNRTCEHCGGQLPLAARRHARFCCPAHRAAHHRTRSVRFLSGATFDKSTAPYAYVGIVSDKRWSGMYRLKRTDGSLSDIVNLSRARDALRAAQKNAP
jgi:hypothetical protein